MATGATLQDGTTGIILRQLGSRVLFQDGDGNKRWIEKELINSVFESYRSVIATANHFIKSNNETIEKCKQIIEDAKKTWEAAKEYARDCRHRMASILSRNNVHSYRQLKGAEQKEFLTAMADNGDAKSQMRMASADIMSSAITVNSCCSSNVNWIGQKAVAQAGMDYIG